MQMFAGTPQANITTKSKDPSLLKFGAGVQNCMSQVSCDEIEPISITLSLGFECLKWVRGDHLPSAKAGNSRRLFRLLGPDLCRPSNCETVSHQTRPCHLSLHLATRLDLILRFLSHFEILTEPFWRHYGCHTFAPAYTEQYVTSTP